jgi:hypothetical protein
MSKNFKRRLERLEKLLGHVGVPIIMVQPGETREEAWQRHLATKPESAEAGVRIVITCQTQAAPGVGSPPPRPQSPERERIPTPPRPLAITK